MLFWQMTVAYGYRALRERITCTTTFHAGDDKAFGQFVAPLKVSESFRVNNNDVFEGLTPKGGRIMVIMVEERTFLLHRMAQIEFAHQFDRNYYRPEDVHASVDYHEDFDHAWEQADLNQTAFETYAPNCHFEITENGVSRIYQFYDELELGEMTNAWDVDECNRMREITEAAHQWSPPTQKAV